MACRLCCVDLRFTKICFTSGTASKLPVSIVHRAHAATKWSSGILVDDDDDNDHPPLH
jgi:E3 ubiquitin-protein ligase DOA10